MFLSLRYIPQPVSVLYKALTMSGCNEDGRHDLLVLALENFIKLSISLKQNSVKTILVHPVLESYMPRCKKKRVPFLMLIFKI